MKPETTRLIAKARASQRAAILLQTQSYLDFAASRAYYAMFYAAQALLLERGLSFSSHSAVIAAFGREFAKTGSLDPKLHRFLLDAQDMRNLGDYGIGPSITPAQLNDMLDNTEEFLATAEKALQRG